MTSAPRSHGATGGHTYDPPARRSFAWSLPSRRSSMRRSPSARVRASSGPSSGHAERCSRQARRPDRSRQSGGSASRGNPAVGILQGLDAVTRHDISPLGRDHGKPRSATFQFGQSGVVRHPGQRAAAVSAQPGAASTYAAVTASEVGVAPGPCASPGATESSRSRLWWSRPLGPMTAPELLRSRWSCAGTPGIRPASVPA
jgi:hypothetical protein